MSVHVVFVHGIRTSATMWRTQLEHLDARGVPATAVDLPGHGTRMEEDFTLHEALHTIDAAVRAASEKGRVLLVGHSMGGLLSLAYTGGEQQPPVDALVAASCTALPRGAGLAAYRLIARAVDRLPDRGLWFTERVLEATIPPETRNDFAAGGYALDAQDGALGSLADLDIVTSVSRIRIALWWVNGQYDQLRINERMFQQLTPQSELIVVPRTTHLVTAMRPRVFNAVLDVAVATLIHASETSTSDVLAQTW